MNWWITLAMWLITYSHKNAYRLVCYNERHDCWGKHFFTAGKNYRYAKYMIKSTWKSNGSQQYHSNLHFLRTHLTQRLCNNILFQFSYQPSSLCTLVDDILSPPQGQRVRTIEKNTLILSAVLCVMSLHMYFVGPLSDSQIFTRQTNRHTDIYVDIRTLTCL